jgi:hypothetical protein
MGLKTFGLMAVDWEERVNIDRLRQERLARVKSALKKSEIGALLCFDMNNIRYITATHIGTWAMDKLVRFSLLPQDDEPILWDFGSAARHHQIYCLPSKFVEKESMREPTSSHSGWSSTSWRQENAHLVEPRGRSFRKRFSEGFQSPHIH